MTGHLVDVLHILSGDNYQVSKIIIWKKIIKFDAMILHKFPKCNKEFKEVVWVWVVVII